MDLKMMKTAELTQAIADADAAHWHYCELAELRCEEQDEDEALHCNAGSYDQEIDALEEKASRAMDRMSGLLLEQTRRLTLSNHARLAEAAMRGEVPA